MSRREKMLQRIRSKAQDHPDSCVCTTCQAAAGDEKARRKLLSELL